MIINNIVNSLKVEFILLRRNWWTWISLSIFIFYSVYLFYKTVSEFDPGRALENSEFIVMGGIFASIIFGFSLVRHESVSNSDEVFYSLPNGYNSKIIGKSIFLILTDICIQLILLSLLFSFYYFYQVPFNLYKLAVFYSVLYWNIPFLIAGIIGMTLGLKIRSRIVYPIIVLIWITMGPLNYEVFKPIMALTNINLAPILDILNLGQFNPRAPLDYVYGYELEIYRWIQRGIILVLVFVLFLLALTRKEIHTRIPKTTLSIIIFALAVLTYLFVVLDGESQIRIANNHNSESMYVYDYTYYSNSEKTLPSQGSFTIQSYDIDLQSYQNLKVKVKVEINPTKETNQFLFTLYHRFKVNQVTLPDNQTLSFKQRGDHVEVTLLDKVKVNEQVTIIFDYEGKSSPFFFSNELAVMLPSYFPWLPINGSHQAMTITDKNQELLRYPLQPQNPIKYKLRYSGPNPMYTNLPKNGDVWKGTVPHGITIVGGSMMTERVISNKHVYYPLAIYKMIDTVPYYLKKVDEILPQVQKDLGVEDSNKVSHVYFVSVPPEENANIWLLDDHMIIGVNKWFKNGEVMKADIYTLDSIVSALIRTENVVNQNENMRNAFLGSYLNWYGYRSIENKQDYFKPMEQILSSLQNPQGNQINLDEKNLKNQDQIHSTLQDINLLIKQNHQNVVMMKSFFQGWLQLLDQKEKLEWNDLYQYVQTQKKEEAK